MASAGPPRGFASRADAAAHAFVATLADAVTIEGPDGHHLERVRRLRVGEWITLADGTGAWRRYRITATGKARLDAEADGVVRAEPALSPRLAVAFGVGKGAKPEQVVSGLTELGVDRIVPFLSARSVVRWDGERGVAAGERLRRVAREAAMQCRRSRVPEVTDPVPLAGLVTDGVVVVGDPDGMPAASLEEPAGGEWLAVVGAEGGLDPAERASLAGGRAVAVAVGPHVLRTETAALAVAAVLAGRRVTTQSGQRSD
jgi:16S rRNA (uracil1498-N3)-methyltransferase